MTVVYLGGFFAPVTFFPYSRDGGFAIDRHFHERLVFDTRWLNGRSCRGFSDERGDDNTLSLETSSSDQNFNLTTMKKL